MVSVASGVSPRNRLLEPWFPPGEYFEPETTETRNQPFPIGDDTMRTKRNRKRDGVDGDDPLKEAYYFEELPADIKQAVFEGVKYRSSSDWLQEDVEQLGTEGVNDLWDELTDDLINRHNWKRTVKEWFEFAG